MLLLHESWTCQSSWQERKYDPWWDSSPSFSVHPLFFLPHPTHTIQMFLIDELLIPTPPPHPSPSPRHCISITRRWHDCYFFLSVFVSAPFYCFVYTDSAQPVSQDSKYKRISCKVESRQNCFNSLFTSQLFHCCRILVLQHYF